MIEAFITFALFPGFVGRGLHSFMLELNMSNSKTHS